MIEKADGTFLHGFFFHEIKEKQNPFGVVIGSYPLFEVDAREVCKKHDITAVLSLQTDEEISQRGINERLLVDEFRRHGVKTYYRFGLSDDDDEQYSQDLFEAQQILSDLVENKQEKVYVHCTTGITRSPSVICAYGSLNMINADWKNPEAMERIVSDCHRYSEPNMRVVTKCISDNRWYTDEILEKRRKLELDKERLRREEEAYRLSLDKITKQEKTKLLRQREDYLRREKERIRAEQERIRLEEERRRRKREEEAERKRQHELKLVRMR